MTPHPGLVASGEDGSDVYLGRGFATLVGLIDGRRSNEEVLDACPDAERAEAAAALSRLRQDRVVVDRGAGEPTAADVWWSSQRIAPALAASRLRETKVMVAATGELDRAPVVAALGVAGVQVTDQGRSDLHLVLTNDYLDPELPEINARALEDGGPWLLARPATAEILVGPVLTPDRGPCWECLAQRLRLHHARFGDAGTAVKVPPALTGVGTGLVVSAVARWLAGLRRGSEAQIHSLDTRTLAGGRHTVVWRPQCPVCGVGEAEGSVTAAPIRVRHDTAALPLDGLRAIGPEVTLRRFEHHVSHVSGVIAVLEEVEASAEVHVHVAGPRVPRVHGDRAGTEALGRLSGGKGTTAVQSRASAVCEALERYCGTFVSERPRRTGTFEALAETAIHPDDLQHFSAAQYRERERWNADAVTLRTWVPEPFDPGDPIDWTPVWSLTADRERLLPTAFCYMGAEVPGSRYCVGDSNGNAGGNTLQEAILHGTLELIERDHAALWWYNRLPAAAIALDTVADGWPQRLRSRLGTEGHELWAVDLTADLGVAVVAAVIVDQAHESLELGFGAHPDRGRAASRAVTEVCQLAAGAPSGGLGAGARGRLSLGDHPFVRPDPSVPPIDCTGANRWDGGVEAALELCRQAIERQGIEILVLDQTQPDIGLPVVKVIAPGLRHFWPRFGPGRLYDVPVALGRLHHPRAEAELTRTYPIA
jgi:oxazoline/thiazoline synthase